MGTTFQDVDWSAPGGQRIVSVRGLVFGTALLALAGLYVYAMTSVDPGDPVAFGWPIGQLEWLWLLSLIGLGYGLWPLAVNRRRTIRYLHRLKTNPVGVVAGLYLTAFFLTATLGPVLMKAPDPAFVYGDLPPVGFTIDADAADGCKNVVGDTCWGTWAHPFGTTGGGKDVLGLVVYGSRLALEIAMVGALVIVPLATVVGTAAAGFGGWFDDSVTGLIDIQRTIPALFVFLVVRVLTAEGSVFFLVLIFGLIKWGSVASVVRSRALDELDKGYVTAAESAGASRWRVIRDHLIPNVAHVALTAAILQVPFFIIVEATLSYLEVGSFMPAPILTMPPTVISWGSVIAQNVRMIGTLWWTSVFPVLALFITVLALNVFGDSLRGVLDPRAR